MNAGLHNLQALLYMKKIIRPILLLLFVSLAAAAHAQQAKDTIRIGIFIESLYDLDFAVYSYKANFWMWSVAKGDLNDDGHIDGEDSLASLERIEAIELSNAKEYEYSHKTAFRVEKDGQTYWWAEQFCKAGIYQKWLLDNYPFDRQGLIIKFENSAFDTSEVIMVNEQDSLTFKDDINLIGWKIADSKIESSVIKYNTDFGDPNGDGTSFYSRVVFNIGLERISATAYFVRLCLGVFVAFLVAMLAFAISPPDLDSRFGLGVGALFAVAANKYVVDSSIPENATNCLVDQIHELTFVYIFFTLIASVIALILHKRDRHRERKIFNWISAITIFVTYVLVLVWFGLLATGHNIGF
jgi:hypothetical protein